MTDRKSLLALRGVGPESEAESVRFHGRRVTKVGPEVKPEKAAAGGLGAAEQGVREAHLGAAGPATFTSVGDQKPACGVCGAGFPLRIVAGRPGCYSDMFWRPKGFWRRFWRVGIGSPSASNPRGRPCHKSAESPASSFALLTILFRSLVACSHAAIFVGFPESFPTLLIASLLI